MACSRNCDQDHGCQNNIDNNFFFIVIVLFILLAIIFGGRLFY